ncbi:eukaryotic aspartyl protease [Ancylostoma caninum]|uniref:Eukaryotic aspartyl protease n=1 Tax=Ancylostoma caninum TaxID=29170 RepID=A0A368G9H4_ANCCA|nr:eukaryotic aspartyl protease [Ancylostoma caninum]
MIDEQQQNTTTHSKYLTWQALTSWNDEFYLGKVFVGTPGQPFFLSMDTSSSTMWIIDGACDSPICNGYPDSGRKKYKFHYDNSTTFLHTNSNFALNDGTKWTGGFIGRDTVAFGSSIDELVLGRWIRPQPTMLELLDCVNDIPKTSWELTVWHGQPFGVANSLAPFFGTVPIDGVFGLGWNEFDNMRAPISVLARYLDSKQFTVWMNRSATDRQGQIGGYITYGGYDDIHCDRNMFYAPLAMDNKWAVEIESFEIGSYTYASEGAKVANAVTNF